MNLEKVINDPFGATELWELDSEVHENTVLEKDYRVDIAFKKVNIEFSEDNLYINRIMNNLFIKEVQK